jgi:hypothetical protein
VQAVAAGEKTSFAVRLMPVLFTRGVSIHMATWVTGMCVIGMCPRSSKSFTAFAWWQCQPMTGTHSRWP